MEKWDPLVYILSLVGNIQILMKNFIIFKYREILILKDKMYT